MLLIEHIMRKFDEKLSLFEWLWKNYNKNQEKAKTLTQAEKRAAAGSGILKVSKKQEDVRYGFFDADESQRRDH